MANVEDGQLGPSLMTHNVDYGARGMASEAVQVFRSHEALDNLRFANMEKSHSEIKDLIKDTNVKIEKGISSTNQKIDEGFKSYDNKFWTLAVSIIFLLISGLATLIFKIVLPH